MRYIWIISFLIVLCWTIGSLPINEELPTALWTHSEDPRFPSSSECKDCHGKDPDGISSITQDGQDVNIYDDWNLSMKSLSGQDPFWKVQMHYEQSIHGEQMIQDCFRCHAPSAYQFAQREGSKLYLDNLDSLHQLNEGVSCASCHQIEDFEAYNGLHTYSDSGVIKGPYPNPFSGPMEDLYGWPVEYDPIMSESEACMSCHTIIHEYEGEIVPEQTTYLEWKYSDYQVEQKECQQCHMPYILEPIKLASEYPFLDGRVPFAQHNFLGSNVSMIEAILNELGDRDSTSRLSNWTESKEEKLNFLRGAAQLSIKEVLSYQDSLEFVLQIENLTGHKLPTGYPSRKMLLSIHILKDLVDTVLQTPDPLEIDWSVSYAHQKVITSSSDVQLYEFISANESEAIDYSLLNARFVQKDNRIPPKGFIPNDTIGVKGKALQDEDYHRQDGMDQISVRVARTPGASYTFNAELWYVLASPEWFHSIKQVDFPLSEKLAEYFQKNDPYERITTLGYTYHSVSNQTPFDTKPLLYPNPASLDQNIHIKNHKDFPLNITLITPGSETFHVRLSSPEIPAHYFNTRGVYYLFIKEEVIPLIIQ